MKTESWTKILSFCILAKKTLSYLTVWTGTYCVEQEQHMAMIMIHATTMAQMRMILSNFSMIQVFFDGLDVNVGDGCLSLEG